jgi:hypothetical protein
MSESTSKLGFTCSANGHGLGLNYYLDRQLMGQVNLTTQAQPVLIEFQDHGDHVLEIELVGKMPAHTSLDEQGEIDQDLLAEISNITLDSIELGHKFFELSQYHHDYNGNGPATVDRFYGTMGCNGRISFEFSSPSYLWLLEHL